MKVYVDELPKSCKDCPFCEHIEEDVYGEGKHEVACYFAGTLGSVLCGDRLNAKDCRFIQSLADYTKQVRKEMTQKRFMEVLKEYNMQFLFGVDPKKITEEELRELVETLISATKGDAINE